MSAATTGTGHVVCRPASVRVIAAIRARASPFVLWNACGQFLNLPVGEGDMLAILRPALGDQANGPDQGFCHGFDFMFIIHAGSNAPLNSGSA